MREPTKWERIRSNRDWLGFWFMVPTGLLLGVFLAYPLFLGVWLSFTNTKIGRAGKFVGLENYVDLLDDNVFWLSVTNTLLYTVVASAAKFALGFTSPCCSTSTCRSRR